MNEQMSTTSITRIGEHRAVAGQQAEYEQLVREMFGYLRGYRDFLAADLLPPAEPDAHYLVVVRFASEAGLQLWDQSPQRADILRRMGSCMESAPAYRQLSGLEAWFTQAEMPAASRPSRLRMAVVTWLGIFPTVSFVLWLVLPLLVGLPFLLRIAIVTALIVITMTWVVMPQLVKWFHGWLQPQK